MVEAGRVDEKQGYKRLKGEIHYSNSIDKIIHRLYVDSHKHVLQVRKFPGMTVVEMQRDVHIFDGWGRDSRGRVFQRLDLDRRRHARKWRHVFGICPDHSQSSHPPPTNMGFLINLPTREKVTRWERRSRHLANGINYSFVSNKLPFCSLLCTYSVARSSFFLSSFVAASITESRCYLPHVTPSKRKKKI